MIIPSSINVIPVYQGPSGILAVYAIPFCQNKRPDAWLLECFEYLFSVCWLYSVQWNPNNKTTSETITLIGWS